MIVIEHLRRAALRDPSRLAFVSNARSYTYLESVAEVERIAAGLIANGCRPGMSVAVLSPNDPLAFLCVLGVLRAGAAWVPLNARNGAEANAMFLEKVGCRRLIWHGALEGDALVIRDKAPSLDMFVQIDGPASEHNSLDALAPVTKFPAADVPDDPDRICVIVGTGGTTGEPRGVTWTEANWEALLATTWAAMPCDVAPVHLCVAPMTHAAGVLAMMLLPGGVTNITIDKPDPYAIMQMIQEKRITHLYLPPTLLYLMLAHPEVRRFDYSSLRYFIITAAPVAPEKLQQAVNVFGPVIAQCYGQSEAPMVCAFFAPQEIAAAATANDLTRLASCGRPTVVTRIAIMGPDGTLLPTGETGEIVVKSRLVMRGYHDDPKGQSSSQTNGWHLTGDIGRVDGEGFVYVVDRKKDMIITGGFNVFPAEIENIILGHPSVQNCAVIGVPDSKWGEAVKAVIELKPHMQASEDDIIAICRRSLGSVKTPKSVEFRASLPRSAVGKLLKRTLRDEFWVGHARAV